MIDAIKRNRPAPATAVVMAGLLGLGLAGCCNQCMGTAEGRRANVATWPPFMVAAESHPRPVRENGKPRKVVIGTVCHNMYGPFPGLDARCEELRTRVDEMERQARRKYDKGLDLVVLSEFLLNDMSRPLQQRAISLDSPGVLYFRKLARKHNTYLVLPSIITDGGRFYNSAILIDRQGEIMGRYDKAHPVTDPPPAETFEGGVTPGVTFPVFDCDFGRLGMQICFDYCHEEGWHELALKGAELVAWPTQSPSISVAAARAVNNRFYIVSSTWRNDAVVIDPVGRLAADLRPPGKGATPAQDVLVCQIDLEYRLLPWDSNLHNGQALTDKYGDDVGFRFYPEEDMGVFWSNTPATPIDQMIRSIGVWTQNQYEQAERDKLGLFRKGLDQRRK